MNQYVRGRVHSQSLQPIWIHGVATAVIAEQVGQRRYEGPQSHLYTAGLVHDVGRLGLLLSGADYAGLLAREFRSLDEASRLEQSLFGVDHAEAGAFLAKSWNFPPLLCNCIRQHHETINGHEDELIRITQAACALATDLGYPEVQCPSLDYAEQALVDDFLKRTGTSPEDLRELIETRASALGAL
jgi:HD-like signal output (HDOD) protein